MILTENKIAPEFELQNEEEVKTRLADFRGKPVVLYFYPKDDTPGCTTEACSFRDDYSDFTKKDIVILGVSPDTSKSHKKFKEKYGLPFPLLADTGHKVSELYGVWGRKQMMGKEYDGVFRTTFVIDREGMIVKVFEKVKPSEHAQEVLEVVLSL
jgi:peroxiredoxin Q/BCP